LVEIAEKFADKHAFVAADDAGKFKRVTYRGLPKRVRNRV
jgi:hypothetical protein